MSGMFPPPSTPSIHNSAKGNSFSKRMGNTQSKSNEVVASSTNSTTLEDVSVTTQRPFSHDQLNQLWESALTIMSPRHKRARAG